MSKKKTFSDLIKNSQVPVLVDFYADWCGPCKTLSPTVQKVSALHGRIKVIKVNVDKNQHAAMKYRIKGIPTLILFREPLIIHSHQNFHSVLKTMKIYEALSG